MAFRKALRILRVHFRQRRAATVGPDLSHRRTLVEQVLMDPPVLRAIEAEAEKHAGNVEKARSIARRYALEIAADISYPTIRVVERFLKWLWHRIYDGIELSHIERVHDVARGHEAWRGLLDEMHTNRIKRLEHAGFTPDQARTLSELHTPNFM